MVDPKKDNAFGRLINVAASKSARLALCVLAAGSMFTLLPTGSIDPQLALIFGTFGVDAFGILLDRVSKDERISNTDLLREIEATLSEDRFAELLSKEEFKSILARLFEQQERLVEDVMVRSDTTVSKALFEQLKQYKLLQIDLHEGLRSLYERIEEQEIRQEERHQELRRELATLGTAATTRRHSLFSLPPLPKEFVGRENELANLTRTLGRRDKTIIYIGGIRGIGKTYLASRLYQQIREVNTYHPLWVDCQEKSVTLELVLNALAEISNDSELMRLVGDPLVEVQDRVGQVVERFMEPRKIVLFLDNYHHLEMLEQNYRIDNLIIRIAAYCQEAKIVFIGNKRPSIFDDPRLRGALEEYVIEGLTLMHTGEYIRIPDLTENQARRIWEKCAKGTPLAMTLFNIAALRQPLEKLLELPIWEIGKTTSEWLEPIIDDLTPDELTCLLAACVFLASVPLKALEYVYNSSDIQAALYGLQNKGLLDHKPGSGYWDIRHEIIKEYLRERELTTVMRSDSERRMAEYYLRFVLDDIKNHTPA